MTDSAPDQLLTQATTWHQQGNLTQAEALYRQLWEQHPDDNIGYLFGTLQLQKGSADKAVDLLAPLAQRHPESADLHNNLGVAYQVLGQTDLAAKAFQAAITANQQYTQAYLNLGKLLSDSEHWAEAEKCFRVVVGLQPDDTNVRWEWIQCLRSLQRWLDATQELETLLPQIHPPQRLIEARMLLAFLYAQQKRYHDAIQIYEKLLAEHSPTAEMLSNLSYLYEHTGRITQAIELSDRAIQYDPDRPELHNNRGVALRSAHRLPEAESAFAHALDLQPDFALARFNRGSTRLMQENWLAGWSDYEARLDLITPPAAIHSLPRWTGQPIPDQTLLVYCDQGFGDAIQFARFLPQLQKRSQARLILQTPAELVGLFQSSQIDGQPLADAIISEQDSPPPAQACFPLMSAGQLLQLTSQDVQTQTPYLQTGTENPPPCLQTQFGHSSHSEHTLKVGLCWRGNATQAQDHVRTMSLTILSSLAELPGVEWYSLQIDATAQERSVWPVPLHDFTSEFSSFEQTGQFLQALDLIITVDTAVCHLAGALGRKTWVLLPHTPDWRWRLTTNKSLWYPTMSLYRQPTWGDWNTPVQALAKDLETFSTSHIQS